MSVQAGIWNFSGEPITRELLKRLNEMSADYGPDGEAFHFDGNVAMLYRPFHTTTESRLETQPFISAGGWLITWDGRLDNREELITLLMDSLASDRTDVGIVAAAIDRWGTMCFPKLKGDWAGAFWNTRTNELLLARDYLGIRRLFYHAEWHRIIWGSCLESLVLFGSPLKLCDEYVAGYLAFYARADLTPFAHVRAVPPGAFVRINQRNVSIHDYWSLSSRSSTRVAKDEEYAEEFRYLFRQAVRRRLRADRPVLAELSGGFDSPSIVCIADEIWSGSPPVHRLDTLSYYDSKEPGSDDFHFFTEVEKQRSRTGLHLDLNDLGDSLSFEYSQFVPTPGFKSRAEASPKLLSTLHEKGYRVLLRGIGGDEFTGQVTDPCLPMADFVVQLRIKELFRQIVSWSLITRKPLIHLLARVLAQLGPVSIRERFTVGGPLDPWINPSFTRKYRAYASRFSDETRSWFVLPSMRDSIDTIACMRRFLADTLPSVLEKRYPFLDQNLVEFLVSIPPDQLVRPGQRRFLLKKALSGILPEAVLTRTRKSPGAPRSYSATLQRHWTKLRTIVDAPLTGQLGFIKPGIFRDALTAAKNGHVPDRFSQLLKALSLELWLRDISNRGLVLLDSSCATPLVATARRNSTFPEESTPVMNTDLIPK
jgi:asparagine synthase (glutamine-hydrolysing)